MSVLRAAALAVSCLALSSVGGTASAQTAAGGEPGGPLYQKLCSQCHDVKGTGQGLAAAHLLPKPRDFTAEKFKIRHTPSGALPTDDDLHHVLRGHAVHLDAGLEAAVGLGLSRRCSPRSSRSPDFADAAKSRAVTIPRPRRSREESAEGQEVYRRIGCAACL